MTTTTMTRTFNEICHRPDLQLVSYRREQGTTNGVGGVAGASIPLQINIYYGTGTVGISADGGVSQTFHPQVTLSMLADIVKCSDLYMHGYSRVSGPPSLGLTYQPRSVAPFKLLGENEGRGDTDAGSGAEGCAESEASQLARQLALLEREEVHIAAQKRSVQTLIRTLAQIDDEKAEQANRLILLARREQLEKKREDVDKARRLKKLDDRKAFLRDRGTRLNGVMFNCDYILKQWNDSVDCVAMGDACTLLLFDRAPCVYSNNLYEPIWSLVHWRKAAGAMQPKFCVMGPLQQYYIRFDVETHFNLKMYPELEQEVVTWQRKGADPVILAMGPNGSYFVQFTNGVQDYFGLPRGLELLIQKHSVKKLSLGPRGTHVSDYCF